jgi:hypothetical protein
MPPRFHADPGDKASNHLLMSGMTQNPMEEEQKCRRGKHYKYPTCYVGLKQIAIDQIERH